MKRNETLLWWTGAAIAGAIAVASQLWPLADGASRIARLPSHGVWHRTVDVALDRWEREFFGRAQVLKRVALVQRNKVALTVIDGAHNRQAVHDPEFCFRGAGWTVERRSEVAIDIGRARLLRLRKGDTTTEALFWFTDGRAAFAAPWRYWLTATWRRLTFGVSGEEPVLVLLASLDDVPPDWSALLAHWPELARL
jgi:hypothetical protein